MKKGDFLDELLKDFNWILYYTMRIRICQRCWLPDVKFGGADQGKSKKKIRNTKERNPVYIWDGDRKKAVETVSTRKVNQLLSEFNN